MTTLMGRRGAGEWENKRSQPDGKNLSGFAAKTGDVLDSYRMCCNLREACRACDLVFTNTPEKCRVCCACLGINEDLI